MWQLLLAGLLAVAAPNVDVETLQGKSASGELVELTSREVAVKTADGVVRFPTAELLAISPTSAAPGEKQPAKLWIEMTDGGGLAALDFQTKKTTATIKLHGGVDVQAPLAAVRWVHFQAPDKRDEKSFAQWQEILKTEAAGDLLVVRKKDALDYLEGVLKDLDADALQFELDQETLTVKRPKIEGLIYRSAAVELPASICEARDLHGSRLRVSKLSLADGKVQIITPAGMTASWPLEAIVRLDFSNDKVRYLSDLDVDSTRYAPYFAPQTELASLAEFFGLRRDGGLDRAPLMLDGQSHSKGISLHSRGSVTYRLGGKYRVFTALVGIDDSVHESGSAQVKISGDSKILWEAKVTGSKPAQAVQLSVAGVKRLEILVDFGDDLDLGDVVDFCDAKVSK